jgi:hypothetical protein
MAPPPLPSFTAVFPINSDSVISTVPPSLRMAPPNCQMNKNETIRTALSEIVQKSTFEV